MSATLLLTIGNLVLGGLVFLLGLIILRENPRQALNRVVAFMMFLGGLGSIITAMGFLGERPETHAGGLSPHNLAYIWEFFFPTLFLFASIFPRERAFTRRLRSFRLLVYAPHAFHFLLLLVISVLGGRLVLDNLGVPEILGPLANLLGLFFQIFLAIHRALFSLVNLGYGAVSAVLLIQSYHRARLPRLRGQLRVLGVGLTASLVLYSFATSIPTLLNVPLEERVRSLLIIAALTLGSGSIAYAMVRHKFLDTKLLARRGILYALGSAVLVGFYLTVVTQLSQLVSSFSTLDIRVLEPVFLIMAVILFQPAISRLEDRLEQVFLRDQGDYRNVLRRLGKELLTAIDLNEMLSSSIHSIGDALMLDSAHVVALAREGPVVHTGAGNPPSEDAVARLPEVLHRLPLDREGIRLDSEGEGVTAEDRGFFLNDLHTSLVFPLRSKGETVGAILLGDKVTGTEITSDDVALLSNLADQMSVSVQNGLLLRERVAVARMEEELDLARRIQSTFLPSTFPRMPRFEVYGINTPSREVGGDYFDLVPTEDGSFYFVIADVSGKGVPAALLTSMLQASLRTQVGNGNSVAGIVSNINALVARSTSTEQFATFFLAQVDGESLRMRFSNAGHNYPMVHRSSGEKVLLERGGIILGMMEHARFEEGELDLSAGDRIVLFTDGINEAQNHKGEEYGEDRLWDVVQALPAGLTAKEMTERVLEDLDGFLDGEEPQDDVTLMILRVLEGEPASVPG